MRTLKVIAPLTLTAGLIGLSPMQAEARAHLIRATKKRGVYEIVGACPFKVGETIDLPESMEKGAAACLAEPGSTRSLAEVERARQLDAAQSAAAQSAAAIARVEAQAAADAVRAEFAGKVAALKAALQESEEAGANAADAEAALQHVGAATPSDDPAYVGAMATFDAAVTAHQAAIDRLRDLIRAL